MPIKNISFSADGSIVMTLDAAGSTDIVVKPRLRLAEEVVMVYTTADDALCTLANLAADQQDQIFQLTQRLTLQEQRLNALVELIQSVTTASKDKAATPTPMPDKAETARPLNSEQGGATIIRGAQLTTE